MRSLEEGLVLNSYRSRIEALLNELEIDGLGDLLITLAECLMHAFVVISNIFGYSESEPVERYSK